MLKQAVLLAIAACGLHLSVVQACSDVALTNTAVYDAIISARNYDFFAENTLPLSFSMIPAKTSVTWTPLLGCKSPLTVCNTEGCQIWLRLHGGRMFHICGMAHTRVSGCGT
jgi:hypothetical protein